LYVIVKNLLNLKIKIFMKEKTLLEALDYYVCNIHDPNQDISQFYDIRDEFITKQVKLNNLKIILYNENISNDDKIELFKEII